jgi:peptidyl-prolyl cis-trans isomerase D
MRLSTKIWRGVSLRSILIGVIMTLAVVAFTVTGVTTSIGGLDANVAAKVGSQTVSMKNLQLATQRQNRRDLSDESARLNALRSTLDSMIEELVVVEEAERLGWSANDLEVAAWIKRLPVFQDEESKAFDRKRYDDFIKSGQMSELDLFQEGRQSLAAQKYASLLSLDNHLPSKLSEEYARRSSVSFQLEYLELTPSQAVLDQAIAAKAQAFVADDSKTSELEKAYEARRSEFNKPATPQIAAILVAHQEANQAQGESKTRTKDDAKKRAEGLLQQIQGGTDFATLANTMSDDVKTTSLKNGGDLGFVDDTVLDSAALDAAKKLAKDGEVSDIIDTAFGFRILKRTGYRAAVERPLADVKLELATALVRNEVTAEKKQEVATALEPLLGTDQANERDEKIAALQLKWQPITEAITADSRFVAGLGPADDIVRHVFKLRKEKDLIPKVLSVSGKAVLVRLVARNDKPVDNAAIDASRDIQTATARNQFATEARRKLFELYSQNKEIRRNAALFAATP